MKTKKIRIAVIINEHGHFSALGYSTKATPESNDADMISSARDCFDEIGEEAAYIIEAEVPVPEVKTIQGKIQPPDTVMCKCQHPDHWHYHRDLNYSGERYCAAIYCKCDGFKPAE